MSFIPKPQEIYKHFKGNLYQVVTVAEHTETGQQLVIYQAMYGDFKTYARDLEMFTGRVDREKYPDAAQEFRFELQGSDSGRQKRECAPKPQAAQKTTAVFEPPTGTSEPTVVAPKPAAVFEPPTGTARTPEDPGLDPMLEEFLDSDSYEEKLNILTGLHHRITQEMITTMALASDIEVEEGDLEERYLQLKTCLVTLEKYECKRLI